jgi:AAHS family 4-hydroxybenzoate transporter-like MFS transporter
MDAVLSSRQRVLSLVVLAGVFIMDGYDLNAMALAVPHLVGSMGLEAAAFGLVFSAALVGLGAGAALVAPLGDRFGRRELIVGGCLVAALATAATAFSTSITTFLLWRFVTGAALGACLPNCTALSSELAPPQLRATVMAVVSAGIVLGAMGAGLTAPEVVDAGGWRALFFIPAAFAAVLGAVLWVVLPKGSTRPPVPANASRIPQLMLLSRPWLFPFAIFAAALALNAANIYLLTSWAPTVLPQAGFTVDQAARVTGLMQGAGLVLGLATSVLIDRWRPGPTLIGGFALMSACFITILLTAPDPTRWTLLLLIGAGGASGCAMALPALAAYLFPAHVLSSAMGMGVFVARIGAIAGPLIGQAMLSAGASPQAILGVAAVPAGLAAVVCLGVGKALKVRGRVEAAG